MKNIILISEFYIKKKRTHTHFDAFKNLLEIFFVVNTTFRSNVRFESIVKRTSCSCFLYKVRDEGHQPK